MASNPVFNRIEREGQQGYAGFGRGSGQGMGGGYAAQDQQLSTQQLQEMYNQPPAGPVQTGRLTLDDVVMKTLSLFAIVVVFGAVGWKVGGQSGIGVLFVLGGMIVTLALGMVIAFKKTVSVPLIVTYAVAEGLFVGAVSSWYNSFNTQRGGIVQEAVLATVCTFAGMFVAYKTGLIKVNDKFRRMLTMAVFGYLIFSVVNFAYAWIGHHTFGFGGTGMLGIGISIFAVGLASLSLAADFDSIERAIAMGAPQKYSWLLAHGLIVTLVWLYLEFLRLFARLQSR